MVLSVATLDLFMLLFLHISLKDASAGGFVKPSSFQDVGGIDPVVMTPSHNMLFQVDTKLEFVDRDLPWTVSDRSNGYL